MMWTNQFSLLCLAPGLIVVMVPAILVGLRIVVKPVVIAENVEDASKIVIWIAVKKIAEAAGVETVDNATNHLLHQ